MDFFEGAKTVRLKSHHGKYLLADEDHNAVSQDRDISSKGVLWTVEIVPGSGKIRLKSYYGKYLTASDHAFLLGMTGKKVLQSFASKADSALEWEPIAEGNFVKLKARNGNYLRANGGVPPWRNSITHDVPVTSATQEWIFWKVDIMENKDPDPEPAPAPASGSSHRTSHSSENHEETPVLPVRSARSDARRIFYTVMNDQGEAVATDDEDWGSFIFKGHSLKHLTEQLHVETGIDDDIILCARHPLSAMLYQMRLELPPNNAPMHVVVVRAASAAGRKFSRPKSSRALHQDDDEDLV
ncbi:unnamed protein product [Sphagnum jensenii]|uniref:DUF569 domain-containing protein n=1 Tax=Sphagnum jensenii TaxID=128206 RepID=A0ABP1AJL4_9BRYO